MKLTRKMIFPIVTASLTVAVFSTFAMASEPLDVKVRNFPETQRVKGSVSIDGIVSHGKASRYEGIVVPTSRRSELSEIVYAGTVETEGFTALSVSLQGEVKSSNFAAGSVGVMLIPDEEPLLRLLRDGKRIEFPIEADVALKAGSSEYFSSQKNKEPIGFARYRIYLYNTLNRTVDANIYLYLTN